VAYGRVKLAVLTLQHSITRVLKSDTWISGNFHSNSSSLCFVSPTTWRVTSFFLFFLILNQNYPAGGVSPISAHTHGSHEYVYNFIMSHAGFANKATLKWHNTRHLHKLSFIVIMITKLWRNLHTHTQKNILPKFWWRVQTQHIANICLVRNTEQWWYHCGPKCEDVYHHSSPTALPCNPVTCNNYNKYALRYKRSPNPRSCKDNVVNTSKNHLQWFLSTCCYTTDARQSFQLQQLR